jgi:uncharacterized membrane protein
LLVYWNPDIPSKIDTLAVSFANDTTDGVINATQFTHFTSAYTFSQLFNIVSPTNNSVLKYNSTSGKYEVGTDASGTVTSVAASIPSSTALSIAGSPITSTGTLAFTWTGTSFATGPG